MKYSRQAVLNRSTLNVPSGWRNFIRLMLARLQAVSSRNMYSLHGLLALIRPLLGQVFQRLMVVSYCTPGSPHCQAHSAMRCITSRARNEGPSRSFFVTQCVVHDWSVSTARMNSSLTRTDRLAFWNKMEL